jgi:hypothetical protein
MALKDLLVPKWKHSRIDVRLAAINGSETDLKILGEIAKTDVSPLVRMAAIQKIEDEPLLAAIIQSERDREVLECAKKCQEALLKKIIATSHDLLAVFAALKKYDNEKVTAAYICEHELDIETQRTLVGYLKSPQILAKLTENRCALEIAEYIVEQISEKESLKRIAQNASNKKIRSLAQNKIDVLFADPLAAEREITKKLQQCCTGMDISVSPQNHDQAVALLDITHNLWNKYDPQRQHPLAETYACAEKILLDRIEHCNVQKSVLQALETVCLHAEESLPEPVDSLKEKLEQLQTQWAAVDCSVLEGFPLQKFQDRFNTATNVLVSRINIGKQELERLHRHQENLEQCCNELQNYIAGKVAHNEKNYRLIVSKWETLCATGAPVESIQKRFTDLSNEFQEKITIQAESERIEQQNEIEYVHRLLTDMESIAKATPHQLVARQREAAQIKREWEKPYPLARACKRELESAFMQAYGSFANAYQEFKEQESWHQWANEQVKDKILVEIEQVENQLKQGESFSNLPRKLSIFSSQWRRAEGTDKSKEIDGRFSEVCSRIFSLLLVQKTALLETLKAILAKESDHDCAEEIKTIQKQWNDIGYLPSELEKDISEIFYSLCNAFFEQRKEQYQKYNLELHANGAIRDEICAEAEKTANSTDWKTAKETFSQLQQKWDESWPAPQKGMREQWMRFSKSRDLFFERYDAFKTENDSRKEALCENAELLLARCEKKETPLLPVNGESDNSAETVLVSAEEIPNVNYDHILKDAIELQRNWKESGPASKARSEELWQRFNTSLNKVFAVINDEHSKNYLRKETLVKEAEELASSDEWDLVSQKFSDIRSAWKTIGPVARRDAQPLWNRLQTAGDTFFGRRKAYFDALKGNLKKQIDQKELLLAEMELLVRIAGKNDMLKTSQTQSAAEILKKGIELRERLVVDGDPEKTYNNIKMRAFEIIDIWESEEILKSKAVYQLEKRFDDLLSILKG